MNHPEQGARIMGLHLEGNYLNMAMKGGQDPNYIYPPDPQEYKELLNSTQCVKRWSAAPELDGALEFGKYASAHGVLVSLAHTTADYLQVKKAYEAGFTHATHFYNAMTSVHKDREYKHEGTVEGIYLMKDMTVEVSRWYPRTAGNLKVGISNQRGRTYVLNHGRNGRRRLR